MNWETLAREAFNDSKRIDPTAAHVHWDALPATSRAVFVAFARHVFVSAVSEVVRVARES